eukprot:1243067-Prymnesium_polylepis.1
MRLTADGSCAARAAFVAVEARPAWPCAQRAALTRCGAVPSSDATLRLWGARRAPMTVRALDAPGLQCKAARVGEAARATRDRNGGASRA